MIAIVASRLLCLVGVADVEPTSKVEKQETISFPLPVSAGGGISLMVIPCSSINRGRALGSGTGE